MASKTGKDFLDYAASGSDLVKDVKAKKSVKKAERVILWKFIKKVNPNYRFYKVHAELIKQLQRVIDGTCTRLIIQCPPRHGKASSNSVTVLTSKGWTTHGQLRVGDRVFHPSGRQVEVVALSPEVRMNARVHLSNGETIECHMNHEWTVYDRGRWKWRTVETSELVEWSQKGADRCRYQLPDIEALQFDSKDLTMDPYVLGVWLGDGSTGANLFCGAEADNAIADAVEACGYQITRRFQHKTTGVWYYALDGLRTGGSGRFSRQLGDLGVFKDKHIPESYLRSSIPQRLRLLAGLMDTDGSMCPKTGRARIVTASERLAGEIMDLCTTLGFRPYLTSQEPCLSSSGIQGKSTVYTVGFQPNLEIPCALERKRVKRHAVRRRIGIVSAEVTLEGEMGRCIQVSSPDGLYLIGNKLNPTHNSQLASRLLPAAYLLAHPDRTIGLSSYSGEMAEGFSGEARSFFKEGGGLLNESSKAVNYWKTNAGGGLWAAGVEGACTGRTGHLLIMDDPVKGRSEAESMRVMQKLQNWYTSDFYSRRTVTPDGKPPAIVIIQTRWSENDLIGYLLDKEKEVSPESREGWTIVDLPALYEDPDSRPILPEGCDVIPDWRTEIDEPLCPQLGWTKHELFKTREMSSRDFASLYQQRPAPEGGNMFDPTWWQYYKGDDDLPLFQQVILSVDCNFTNNNTSDYVVGTVIGQAASQFYILDMVRQRLDVIGTMAMIARMYKQHQLNGTIIELAANGFAVHQMMYKKVPGLVGWKPQGNGSKVSRASGIVPMVEAGNVYLPNTAPWLDAFINEFNLFPASKNDDMVDSLSMGLNYMVQRTPPTITSVVWGRGSTPLLDVPHQRLW